MRNRFIIVVLALRWPNLLLTALSIISTYYLLLKPISQSLEINLTLDTTALVLLTVSTLLIMAGGYVINDWMDVESDFKNKKNTDLHIIPRKLLLINYSILSLSGLVLALYLSIRLGNTSLSSIHLLACALLLVYSTHLKSSPLAGNILIAFLCGLIPLLPLIYGTTNQLVSTKGYFLVIKFLAFFAFLTNLIREMIKDMEDELGDRHTNLATFPVVFGMEAAKWTCFVFYLLFMVLMTAMLYLLFSIDIWSFAYLLITALAPMIFLSFKLTQAGSTKDFRDQSKGLKYVMLAGVCFSAVYYFSNL